MGNFDWSVSKLFEKFRKCFKKDFRKIYTLVQNLQNIYNTPDGTEDEVIHSEETAELADKEEIDDEFDADAEDEQ